LVIISYTLDHGGNGDILEWVSLSGFEVQVEAIEVEADQVFEVFIGVDVTGDATTYLKRIEIEVTNVPCEVIDCYKCQVGFNLICSE
jgi:hypothetical protein